MCELITVPNKSFAADRIKPRPLKGSVGLKRIYEGCNLLACLHGLVINFRSQNVCGLFPKPDSQRPVDGLVMRRNSMPPDRATECRSWRKRQDYRWTIFTDHLMTATPSGRIRKRQYPQWSKDIVQLWLSALNTTYLIWLCT